MQQFYRSGWAGLGYWDTKLRQWACIMVTWDIGCVYRASAGIQRAVAVLTQPLLHSDLWCRRSGWKMRRFNRKTAQHTHCAAAPCAMRAERIILDRVESSVRRVKTLTESCRKTHCRIAMRKALAIHHLAACADSAAFAGAIGHQRI